MVGAPNLGVHSFWHKEAYLLHTSLVVPRTLPFGKTLAIDAFVALLIDAGLVADLGVEAFGGDFTLFQARSSAGHILFIDPSAVTHISTVTS